MNIVHDDRARHIAEKLSESVRFIDHGSRDCEAEIRRDWPRTLVPEPVAKEIEEFAIELADAELHYDPRDDPDYQRDREWEPDYVWFGGAW